MRDNFILACRIVGLILFAYALMVILQMLPMLFMRPDMSQVLAAPEWVSQTNLWKEMVTATGKSTTYIWFWMLLNISLRGVIPLLFGLYLMVSGSLLINLCYPDKSGVSQTRKSSFSQEEESELDRVLHKREDRKNDDRKYMPPEMRGEHG